MVPLPSDLVIATDPAGPDRVIVGDDYVVSVLLRNQGGYSERWPVLSVMKYQNWRMTSHRTFSVTEYSGFSHNSTRAGMAAVALSTDISARIENVKTRTRRIRRICRSVK